MEGRPDTQAITSAGAGTRDETLRTSAWEANITEL